MKGVHFMTSARFFPLSNRYINGQPVVGILNSEEYRLRLSGQRFEWFSLSLNDVSGVTCELTGEDNTTLNHTFDVRLYEGKHCASETNC